MARAGAAPAAWLLLAASGGLVLGALGFQFLAGLAPCEMCHWQRWAHLAVIAGAVASLRVPALLPLAIVAMAGAAGLGLFHAGVEQGWWEGPTQCAATASPEGDLLGNILAAPLVRCDQIPWSLFGLSMAGWNALWSATAAIVALLWWRRA